VEWRGHKVADLPSTIIDGEDAEKLFTDLGFEVTVMHNPKAEKVVGHLSGVSSRASKIEREQLGNGDTKGGILLGVYFAGHGFSMEGKTTCLYNQKERTYLNPHPLEN
jgi:hypothetical protein